MQEKQQWAKESNDCEFRPQRYKFPQRLRWSQRRRATMNLSCNRPNGIMKNAALRKSKYYINTGSFWLHNNCGSTHPSVTASKEHKLPPSFRVLNLKNFSLNPAMLGSQKQTMMNIEQTLNNSASVFYLWLLKAFSWFQNGNILLVNASCKRRALITKHLLLLIIVNRVIFNRLVTM